MEMKNLTLKPHAFVALWLALNLSIGSAASPAIGVAVTGGAFHLDASKVTGNGTLFEGSVVETAKATSLLKLNNGVRMVLDGDSRSKVYGDRMMLERGTGQIDNGGSYRIEARTLRIEADHSSAKVAVKGENRVLVSALRGPVRVRNAAGVLVANLSAGNALEFEPQAGASAPVKMKGTLVKKDGHYLLTDKTSGVTVEVQGEDLEKKVGKIVEISGAIDPTAVAVAGATQVVTVTSATVVGAGAVGVGAGTGAAIGTKAVIAGVVVAGAATGSAVALTRDEKTKISQ